MRRLLVIGAALASALALAPSAAAATPTWTTAVASQPANASSQQQLSDDVTCPSAGSCVIIGTYDELPQARVFIDTMSAGRVVSSIEPPMPRDALGPPYQTSQELRSISCWAVGSCVAVGQYTDSEDRLAGLIETLHNGVWTARRSPGGTGSNRRLDEVACNSERCVAVGSNLGATVVERAAGGTWQVQEVTTGATTGALQVQHASCPPSGACYLTVVSDFASGHERALFAYPSGEGWHAVYFPIPTFGEPAQLRVGRLSCPVDGTCSAFGSYQEQGQLRHHPIVEDLSGGQLSVSMLPTLSGYVDVDPLLEGVSCGTVTRCGGFAYVGSAMLLYRLTTAGWRVEAAAHGIHANSVSCSAEGACVIAGSDGTGNPYVLTLTGRHWVPNTLSFPPSTPTGDVGALLHIGCAARTCVAVGDEGNTAEAFISRTLLATGRSLPIS